MKNFNLKELWLVKPRVTIGVEATAYAVNARDILSSVRILSTLQSALVDADLIVGTTAKVGWSTRNVLRTPIDPKLLAKQLSERKGRIALLFGRESKGLANRELDLCDIVVTIPTSHAHRTLNVAAAATIIFYELFVSMIDDRSTRKTEADRRALQNVEDYFKEICRALKFSPHKEEITIRAFRNVLHRGYVSRREASLLIGFMRRTNRKVRTEG